MNRLFDLDFLRTLVVISETGSFSASAPRLCRSQSAISEQIRKLEEMCEITLFVRSKSGATLTPAGERLVGHALELLALSDAALRDMQDARLAGDLHLAITDYFRPTTLPNLLRRIRDRFPHLHLHVSIRKSVAIHAAKTDEFDIGLAMSILEGDGLPTKNNAEHVALRREPLVWVADKSFTMPENGIVPLVVLPDTCSLQRFIVKSLKSCGTPYVIALSASGVAGLQMALRAGLGITCINASAIPEGAVSLKNLVQLPAMPEIEFNLVVPHGKDRAPISEVRQMLAEHLH